MNLLNAIKSLALIIILAISSDALGTSKAKTEAATRAKNQYGGKVLSVTELNKGGQTFYKVKLLLDSGRVKIVKVKHR